ncbi:uncharacterized protein NFIA_096020 [Aspergillus fischeri NRRL 181]|uniref:Uncharacterized protein n=1 Tax=Neosartorya fischeri (strain ATCC 1020 / DSM 3700 / CBS 544.65 / FGSC A1164 / JCM 1740 / NRRL 181 / WB 181) TaxID=331117 RepID=A1DAU2_NEOFI|nr:uncharacterized protein NFIA_096020 [Aspergillus fischeri NRRL 181]EAW19982.1 hypothetical protein NFIA_096020 [Aspergillus fischeri NRRL 181]
MKITAVIALALAAVVAASPVAEPELVEPPSTLLVFVTIARERNSKIWKELNVGS